MARKPAYIRMFEDIVSKIENDIYSVGDLLPSEAEMEKIYGVSRTPVRATLKQLENEKYIYRVQGKGSYVANKHPKWTAMTGFQDFYTSDWENITAETRNVELRKHKEYAQLYNLKEDSELIFLERVRFYNQKPVVYQEHYLTQALPLEFFEENRDFLSVQEVYNKNLGISYTESEEEIEAVIGENRILEAMKLPVGTPLIKAKRYSYDHNQGITDINIFYVNTTIWKYRVHYKL